MSTSVATTRPFPSARGTSCWQTTAESARESCCRTVACCSAGKMSVIRFAVWGTSFVCSVARTRCPVSAAVSAARVVSRSRISPTRITSGSCRRAATSAAANVGASAPTSTCSTIDVPWACSYSTGSSIVTTCRREVRLILSTRAASVVVFPDPVAPVTRTRPRDAFVSS